MAQIAQRHAEAPAEHPEDRILGGHAKVAPEGQLDPAGHGVALDGGDHGFAQCQAGRPHRTRTVVGDGPAVPFGHRFQVGPGAECPGRTGQHGHGALLVAVEGHEGLPQLIGADAVDGVAALGTVDGDHGHGAVVLDQQGVGPVRAVATR
jgi:hypothetical protein